MKTQNIWCVGRNYKEHAKELGNPIPSKPLIFLKSGSSIIKSEKSLTLPEWAGEIHHEVELAVFFDEHLVITEGAVALDLTAREIQNDLKKQGHPWTLAKSFKNSCPLGKRFPIADLDDLQTNGSMQLIINGEQKQLGHFKDMIFSIRQLSEYILEHFPVCPGDMILTGTPEGVGPLKTGDHIKAEIFDKSLGSWEII